MPTKPAIGKVRLSILEKLLSRHGLLWDVEADRSFTESVAHRPMTPKELVDTIACYIGAITGEWHENVCIYVYSDDDVNLMVSFLKDIGTPDIDEDQLEQYILRWRGSDFLRIACTEIDLANASYVTILRHDEEDDAEPE